MNKCLSCGTKAIAKDSRFCVKCGWPLRQKCHGCDTWLLLGGSDLKSGRCPNCMTSYRSCKESCGRLHTIDCLTCYCKRNVLLPKLRTFWSMATGLETGLKSATLDTFSLSTLALKQSQAGEQGRGFDGSLRMLLHDGEKPILITDERIHWFQTNEFITTPCDPGRNAICVNGSLFAVAGDELHELPANQNSFRSQLMDDEVGELHWHGYVHEKWFGLTTTGKLVDSHLKKMGSLGEFVEIATAHILCGSTRSIIFVRGELANGVTQSQFFELAGECLTEISFNCPGEVNGLFWSGSFPWCKAKSGSKESCFRIEDLGVDQRGMITKSASYNADYGFQVVTESSQLICYPSNPGQQVTKYGLLDASHSSCGVINSLDTIFDVCAIDNIDETYVLSAGIKDGSMKVTVANLDTGNAQILETGNSISGCDSCRWMVSDKEIFLAVGAGSRSYVLEYSV